MKSYLTASFIGIIVAICGNVVISFALNCQKLAHKQVEQRRNAAAQKEENVVHTDRSQQGGADRRRESLSPSRSRSRTNTSSYASTINSDTQPLLFKPNYPHRSYTEPVPGHSPAVQFTIPIQPLSGQAPISPSPQRRKQSQTGSGLSKSSNKTNNSNNAAVAGIPEDPEAEERWRSGDRDRESSNGTIRPSNQERVVSWVDANGQNLETSKPSPPRSSRFNGTAEETEYLKSRLWYVLIVVF